MTSMPRALQMMGIQSINLTWTSEPFRREWEKVEASMKKKKPRENCQPGQYDGCMRMGMGAFTTAPAT